MQVVKQNFYHEIRFKIMYISPNKVLSYILIIFSYSLKQGFFFSFSNFSAPEFPE